MTSENVDGRSACRSRMRRVVRPLARAVVMKSSWSVRIMSVRNNRMYVAAAAYMRLLRTDMIRTLQDDFITTARAKGLSTRRILFRLALRPSTFSLVTVIGLQVGALLGGALVIENIFSIPGMGKATVDAVFRKDYLVVQAIVLIIATAYVLVNFLIDALYAVLDPRVRGARA